MIIPMYSYRFQRPPGLPSSMLGLESLTGELDEFGFEDYLNSKWACLKMDKKMFENVVLDRC